MANEEVEDCQKRLLQCKANERLADCEKRVAEPPKDAQKHGGEHNADQPARDRDREPHQRGERRDRDDSDRERRERNHRDDNASGRQRGEADGDDGRRRRRAGGKRFEANKTFGLGLELGEPTGLNGKYFLSDSGALDFGIGVMYSPYYFGDGFHIYADYLWHPISLVSASAFELPLYIGGGLRFWDFHYCFQGTCDFGGSAIGIRIPFGIAFDFNHVPLDLFIQFVPVIDFLNGNFYDRFHDRAHFGVDVSLGLRYWFK